MDPNRFDRFSKSIARRLTRRQMFGGLGAGALAASVLANESSRAADERAVICVYDFDGTIDLGPSSKLPSSNQITGELTLAIEPDGAINKAQFVKPDGETWRVVGQATGRAISLRFSVPHTGAFIAVGAGRNDISACTSAMSGPASGPMRRDAGSWSATLKSSSSATPVAATAVATTAVVNPVVAPTQESSGEPTAEPTAVCDLECGADTLGLDAGNCVCLCPSGQTNCTFEIGSIPAKGGVIFKAEPLTKPRGFCIDLSSDTSNCGACGQPCEFNSNVASNACQGGTCSYQCKPDYDTCDDTGPCMTYLQYNTNHCGACGNACVAPQGCAQGHCTCVDYTCATVDANCNCVCPAGQTSCGSYCADTQTDVKNCGGCGHACGPVVSECSAGVCHPLLQGGA